MSDTIHSCGYHCRIPACVLSQRDYLVATYVAQPVESSESEKHSFVRATMKHHGIDHYVHTALVADLVYGLEALAQPADQSDKDRLDWLEKQQWDSDDLFEIVNNWTTQNGKRHVGGLRDSIDAAIKETT